MLVSREWYKTIKGDTGWMRRAKQLGASPGSSFYSSSDKDVNQECKLWFQRWLDLYTSHCLLCKTNLRPPPESVLQYSRWYHHRFNSFHSWDRFPGEPDKVEVCTDCKRNGRIAPVIERSELAGHSLLDVEVLHLYAGRSSRGFVTYRESDILRLENEKVERRAAEMEGLLEEMSSDQESQCRQAIDAAKDPPKRLRKHLTSAYQAILLSADAPTLDQLFGLSSLYKNWLAVPKALKQHLLAEPKEGGTIKQAIFALDWLFHSESTKSSIDELDNWRDALASGDKTYAAFATEVWAPTISQTSWVCATEGCPKCPALHCVARECTTCCSNCAQDHEYDSDCDRASDGTYHDGDD